MDLVGDKDGLKVGNNPTAASYVLERLSKKVGSVNILEVCCGVGVTTIYCSKFFNRVFAIDISKERILYAKKNMENYKISNVEFFVNDIFDPMILEQLRKYKIDAIHTDVEWTTSGIYGQDHAVNLVNTNPDSLKLFHYLKNNLTPNVCMRLPKDMNRNELRLLGPCEIQEFYKNGELKFIYAYFGSFAEKGESRYDYQ